jgi:hypothetical protein
MRNCKKSLQCLSVLIVLLFVGCASHSVKPVCRHWAIFEAVTYNNLTGCETRIIGYPTKANKGHAQAQARLADGWHWLKHTRDAVIVGDKVIYEPPKTCIYTVHDFTRAITK